MFTSLVVSVVAALVAMPPASPATAPQSAAPRDFKRTMLTMNGCVSADRAVPGAFTFAETDTGAKYRLGGVGVKKYVGRRVEIVGAPVGRRLTFRGGLYPSPNVAGQAGAMDPVKAAIAGMPGGPESGTGSEQLPEFRVRRVRALDGACQ